MLLLRYCKSAKILWHDQKEENRCKKIISGDISVNSDAGVCPAVSRHVAIGPPAPASCDKM